VSDDPNCLCRPDEDGTFRDATAICDRHRMASMVFDGRVRDVLDAEQDERFRVMFARRNLEPSTVPTARFAVRR
jgi:hypothetical protein